jgi:hypothetical protein
VSRGGCRKASFGTRRSIPNLVPGIIPLVANGLLSLWVLRLAMRRHPGYGWWVAAQGWVLLGWLAVEVAMLRLVVWPPQALKWEPFLGTLCC